jgi:prolyl-tRNA editing enzyme YbaK/EbsC (Cys-tRNA(Pro) deacylase)
MMWPEPVERIATFLRDSDAIGRLEELPPDSDTPPGPAARADAFDCDGRTLVVLVPLDRSVDEQRVVRRAGCRSLRPSEPRTFPFQGTVVLVDRSLLSQRTVWLEAGSPRHVLGLAPSQLLRLTRAETGAFAAESHNGGF